MKILYIEDNLDAVHPIQRIASHFGYDLLLAETVVGGLSLLAEAPTLVLADMLLPDGDAIDFIRQARLISATVPIIVVTGVATDGEREACLEVGCTDYYIKPIEVDTLIALFKRYADEALK